MATASGSCSGAWWWSRTTASSPRLRASASGIEAGRPAIDRHQETRTLLFQRPDRLDIGTIAFGNAVGDVDDGLDPAGAKIFRQQSRAARAVHVVIPEDRDLLPRHDRIRQPVGGDFHVGHHMRVRHEIAQARVEEPLDIGHAHAPAGEDAGEYIRKPVRLCDGKRDGALSSVAALDPGAAEGRPGDVQEGTGQREGKS